MAAPARAIITVIVSNIAKRPNVLLRPAGGANDVHAYTVKKFSRGLTHIPRDRGFCATDVPKIDRRQRTVHAVAVLQPLSNHRKRLPISASFPMRYRHRRGSEYGPCP